MFRIRQMIRPRTVTILLGLLILLVFRATNIASSYWTNVSYLDALSSLNTIQTENYSSDHKSSKLEHTMQTIAARRLDNPSVAYLRLVLAHLLYEDDSVAKVRENFPEALHTERPLVNLWLAREEINDEDYGPAIYHLKMIGAARQLWELGDKLVHVGNLEYAADAYLASIEVLNGDVQIYLKLGSVLQDLGELEKALAIYGSIIERFPANYAGYVAIGDIYRDQGLFEAAHTWYFRAIEESGNLEWPNLASARTYQLQGDFDRAAERLYLAIDSNPLNCQAWGQLGIVLGQQGQLQDAVSALNKSVQLCSEIPWLFQALGDFKLSSGDIQGAQEAFRTYEELLTNGIDSR